MFARVSPSPAGPRHPIDCVLNWSSWSQCANKRKVRFATIVSLPRAGGKQCGALYQEEHCFAKKTVEDCARGCASCRSAEVMDECTSCRDGFILKHGICFVRGDS